MMMLLWTVSAGCNMLDFQREFAKWIQPLLLIIMMFYQFRKFYGGIAMDKSMDKSHNSLGENRLAGPTGRRELSPCCES